MIICFSFTFKEKNYSASMNGGPRRGSRKVKLRKDKDFVYEEKSVEFLLEREDKVEANGSSRTSRHSSSESADIDITSKLVDNAGKVSTFAVSSNWSDIKYTLVYDNSSQHPSGRSVDNISSLSLRRSQSPVRDSDSEASGSVNNFTGYNSSTRQDFLEDCFLSASPTVRSRADTSDMPDCGECDACLSDAPCTVSIEELNGASGTANLKEQSDGAASPSLKEVTEALWAAVDKIGQLTVKVNSLERHIVKQDKKIDTIIESSKEDSSVDTSKVKVKSVKGKKDRVEEEKAKQLKLLQERIRGKDVDDSSKVESSEDEVASLTALRKKMSKKQRDLCGRKVAARMHQAGALFPQDEFESTTCSGTDSDNGNKKCRHSSQVKSGAKMRKRPVLQTELWPHTIANEDDGEEVTSENISLAKFLSCFSFIMLTCSKVESRGRTALLHAVSIVLEYLQWSEARAFHNLMLIKIEQGRIDWTTDFSGLAENFIDKKVRLSIKAKRYPAGASSSYKAGYSSKNIGKGYGTNFKSNITSGNSKSLHGVICWQWNNGTCTYGDNCKRWNVCRVCADAGELGEPHKASTHVSSGSRARPAERT